MRLDTIRVVAGLEVVQVLNERQEREVPRSETLPDCYASEPLCAFQARTHMEGYRGAKLVMTMYGWSVRADSGLDGRSILASSRLGHVDGSLAAAEHWGRVWAQADPTKRYVWAYADSR